MLSSHLFCICNCICICICNCIYIYNCICNVDCICICMMDCRMQKAWAAAHTFAAVPICKKNVSCKPAKEITHANVPYEGNLKKKWPIYQKSQNKTHKMAQKGVCPFKLCGWLPQTLSLCQSKTITRKCKKCKSANSVVEPWFDTPRWISLKWADEGSASGRTKGCCVSPSFVDPPKPDPN